MKIVYFMAAQQEYGPQLRSKIDVVITGVGPVEAATTAALHLQHLQNIGEAPDFVVSLGSAASKNYEVGSIWQIASVSWRDMDATKLGFEKGVTPFADHAPTIALYRPDSGLRSTTLSTGADVVGPEDFSHIPAELADMETFALMRVCQRFSVPLVGVRAVSDGAKAPKGLDSWEKKLILCDAALADALPAVQEALARIANRRSYDLEVSDVLGL